MTKKHFIKLADVLRDLKPQSPSEVESDSVLYATRMARLQQWEETCAALAEFCRSQNSQFNTPRWFGYIDGNNGPNGGKL